jgi:hypothetical protein
VKIAPMVVAAALAMGVLVAPALALAQRGGPVVGGSTLGVGRVPVAGGDTLNGSGRAPVVGGATLGVSRSVAVPFPPRFFVKPHHFRPFPGFGVVAGAPTVVYAPPAYYPAPVYDPALYYDPQASYSAPMPYGAPVSYSPPPTYAPPPSTTVLIPPAPRQPDVVNFATGRYELRGDGVSTPYTWAWIPNPPTAPPSEEPSSGKPAARRASQLYNWTDSDGVTHWTDRLDAVPPQYRGRQKPVQPS